MNDTPGKDRGKPFFPDVIFKDTIAIVVLFVVLVIVALSVGSGLEEMADPTDTNYNPRPEWYFLFLFQALKFFPGSWEAAAAVVLPTLALLILMALPFLDRGPARHPWDRPWWTMLGVVAIAGVSALTIMGIRSPRLNPEVHQDPQIVAGRRLYRELRCAYCHSIQGHGGMVGPDLTTVGARRDQQWLAAHFQDPTRVIPGSLMPQLHLLPDEIVQLVVYLTTLGGEGPFTPQAPALYAEQCQSCHALDGTGGALGPDLTTIRTYRNKAYIYQYIGDPASLNPETTMPGYHTILTDAQIEDLARYLSSAQRPTP